MKFAAQCAVLGTATALDVFKENDPDALLALQATNIAAIRMRDQELERQAHHIIAKLAEAMKG